MSAAFPLHVVPIWNTCLFLLASVDALFPVPPLPSREGLEVGCTNPPVQTERKGSTCSPVRPRSGHGQAKGNQNPGLPSLRRG